MRRLGGGTASASLPLLGVRDLRGIRRSFFLHLTIVGGLRRVVFGAEGCHRLHVHLDVLGLRGGGRGRRVATERAEAAERQGDELVPSAEDGLSIFVCAHAS